MNVFNRVEGKLKIDVASEGNYIYKGSNVIVEQIEDNFKNLSVLVTSCYTKVRLPYYDTSINRLV